MPQKLKRGGGGVQPGAFRVIREKRRDGGAGAGVVAIDKPALILVQQSGVNERAVEGREGQGFKAEHVALAAVDGLCRRHQQQALDANAVMPLAVKPRLVGDNHAGHQSDIAALGDALRTLMHIEEMPDAVSGAVVVVQAGAPKRKASEGVQLRAACALGKTCLGEGDVSAQDESIVAALLGRRRADGDGAGDIGGAVQVMPAGIHEKQFAVGEAAVGLLARPIMHDGAVRSGAGDGVETDVLEMSRVLPERFQAADGGEFVRQVVGLYGVVEPSEKAAEGGAVSQMRGAGAGLLGRVFARFGELAWVGRVDGLGAGGFQGEAHGVCGGVFVQQDAPAGEGLQRFGEGMRRVDGGVRRQGGEEFLGCARLVCEPVEASVRMQKEARRDDGGVRDVVCASVEKPSDGVAGVERDGVGGVSVGAEAGGFVGAGFAGVSDGKGADFSRRRGRQVGCDVGEGVVGAWAEGRAALGAEGGVAFCFGDGMEAGVVAEGVSEREAVAQPGGDVGRRERVVGDGRVGDLGAGLEGVASVYEQCRVFLERDGESHGAGETEQPSEVFLVRQGGFLLGDEESVQGLVGERLAQAMDV